ncbi:MAG: PVC-type heme-binding CxxCH protein [Planctomycetaceae bacterium]
MVARLIPSLLLVASLSPAAFAQQDDWPKGMIPKGEDGKPLNLDFETGDLADWTAEGDAFASQPIEGDTVSRRRQDMASGHRGQFWIGGYEIDGDSPQGTLTSKPFEVTQPWASFLVGGGHWTTTRVDLIDATTGELIFRISGEDREDLRPVVADLAKHVGKTMLIRLVDDHQGGWGHVNFDEFRLHAEKPEFSTPERKIENHGLPPEEAAAAMTLPPGFKVTLFAGEPDVVQPIAMTIDDRGRLWVAEGLVYPAKRPPGQGEDRILIFEDENDDGKFDTKKVFLDKLNLVSGLEVGFGGVWIGQAPELLFVPDANGDDVPDGPPQILLDGWHYEDTHETLNSFIWGPDGWLYGCHGIFTHSRVGKPGTPDKDRTPINAGIWRYHPTRHEFEVFAHGTSNPWGVDFNDRGQCFIACCVIPHLYHIIDGGRYFRQAGSHFNRYTYDDVKTIAKHRHWVGNQWNQADRDTSDDVGGGHAHSGGMIYLGGAWPEKYRDQLFMNNIHGDRWNQDVLAAKGSGYVGDRAPDFLLANDAASQHIHFRYGPDGNVYVIDWYDTNECHRTDIEVHDRSNGRIFKIDYAGDDASHDDSFSRDQRERAPSRSRLNGNAQFALKPGQNLKDLSSEQLVELQLHENDWYVRHARRILQERGLSERRTEPNVDETLAKTAFEHDDETRRLRGLWALHATGGLTPERTAKALKDENPYIRGWTIQLALDGRKPTPELIAKFVEMAKADDSPVVRLYLASAAQRLPLAQRWDLLAGLLTHPEDATDHNLPLMYWYATEPLAAADMGRAMELVDDSAVPLVREYALRRIADIGSEEAVAFLVESLGKAETANRQREFLAAINEALKGKRSFPMPEPWANVYSQLSKQDDAEVKQLARVLAVTFGDPNALDQMRSILTDGDAPAEARTAALESLLGARDKQLAAVLQPLVTDPEVGREAIRGLAAYAAPQTPKTLLAAYPKLPADAKRDALNTLASRPEYATALLDAVEGEAIARADLSADIIRQVRNLDDKALNEKLNEVWGVVRDTPEERKKLIAEFRKTVHGGGPPPDVHLGRTVYAKTCSQCHKLFGDGGEVGPELTGSNRGDLEYVLSNVLDPSAVMAKDYQPTVIVTSEGRVLTGIVKQQTDDALTVVTANETVIVPRNEIEETQTSETSMMPDNIWQTLDNHQVRSLVAYLAANGQVPMLANAENATSLFNGSDLAGWTGDKTLWKVENGEIVGTSPGIKHNNFLVSDLLLEDFELTVEVKLTPNTENSGIQFRSEPLPDGEMKGYQADMGQEWWGKLYEESARGLLWDKPGIQHVKLGEWNTYRIRAEGHHIQTWINGHLCVDLTDPKGAKRGVTGLQIHSGGPLEVRFRNFRLNVDPR